MVKKEQLDEILKTKNNLDALFAHPDPLQIASLYKTPVKSLVCALFAYGNAKAILGFLKKFRFDFLDLEENKLKKELKNSFLKYRFQNEEDVRQIYLTLVRLQKHDLRAFSEEVYHKNHDMREVIRALIKLILSLNDYRSRGYDFYFSSPKSSGAYKRYNMFYRWMVRRDVLDFGLFSGINPKDLIMPLDTHTHAIGLALGLCTRKSSDYKTALELTNSLKKFCADDPLKYDFALYRMGQLDGD